MAKKWPRPEIEDVTEPFCGSRRRLLTPLSEYDSELASQWCYKKNCGWGPEDFSRGSSVRAWWLCPSCHREYKAMIKERTTHGTGCPFCASKKACKDNSLKALYSEVAKEFHPSKNGKLTAKDVTFASSRKVWWQCKSGHVWQATVASRTTGERGCSQCFGSQPSKDYNLKSLYPKVAAQWHPRLNGDLSPKHVTPGSSRLVWWLCKAGPDHVWQAPPRDRTAKSTRCPFCAHKKVSVTNSLATLFPKIAREWHKSKNGKLSAKDVLSKSDKDAWWQCRQGHSWLQRIATRTSRLSGCPECKQNN